MKEDIRQLIKRSNDSNRNRRRKVRRSRGGWRDEGGGGGEESELLAVPSYGGLTGNTGRSGIPLTQTSRPTVGRRPL